MAGADWLIELGPEGGEGGGRVIANGTPREVAKKKTPTAVVLREVFGEEVTAVRNGARV
jgi:excinuclease ABC subunit A